MQIRVGILTAPEISYERREHTFLLHNVRIGIGFHWDRLEDQEFEGELEILNNSDGTKTAVNIIDMEQYLTSVISSEMAASAPMELLKAHAVIARSWLIRAIGHTDHVGYDVCADDHCQRYEGIRRRNERAREAVEATRGMVLKYGDEVCDCRYHKCCGGRTEEFETCWEDIHIPYLESVECPYCGEPRPDTALNDYDLETHDYHDWEVTYTAEELSRIVRDKSGEDIGLIKALNPIKRGKSGRIYELEVVGEKQSLLLSKELRIRQYLSSSCLYSSWFTPSYSPETGHFTLRGHGWGHGVGMCQIGGAVMASHGFTYMDILYHYYPHTRIAEL